MGISDATFYYWKKKYPGLGPAELRRLKRLDLDAMAIYSLQADKFPTGGLVGIADPQRTHDAVVLAECATARASLARPEHWQRRS